MGWMPCSEASYVMGRQAFPYSLAHMLHFFPHFWLQSYKLSISLAHLWSLLNNAHFVHTFSTSWGRRWKKQGCTEVNLYYSFRCCFVMRFVKFKALAELVGDKLTSVHSCFFHLLPQYSFFKSVIHSHVYSHFSLTIDLYIHLVYLTRLVFLINTHICLLIIPSYMLNQICLLISSFFLTFT